MSEISLRPAVWRPVGGEELLFLQTRTRQGLPVTPLTEARGEPAMFYGGVLDGFGPQRAAMFSDRREDDARRVRALPRNPYVIDA